MRAKGQSLSVKLSLPCVLAGISGKATLPIQTSGNPSALALYGTKPSLIPFVFGSLIDCFCCQSQIIDSS